MAAQLRGAGLGAAQRPADLAEAIEARFFGPEAELRFYQAEGGLDAALIEHEAGDVVIEREVQLLPKFGKALKQRQYLAFDEDGQGYVALTRLAAWEGGGGDAG